MWKSDSIFRRETHLNFIKNLKVFEWLIISCIIFKKVMYFGHTTEESY
jgi:hypothetical protein